jgi:hypothetical protein
VKTRDIEETLTRIFGAFENYFFIGYSRDAEDTLTAWGMEDPKTFAKHLVGICAEKPEVRRYLENIHGFLHAVLKAHDEWRHYGNGPTVH